MGNYDEAWRSVVRDIVKQCVPLTCELYDETGTPPKSPERMEEIVNRIMGRPRLPQKES